MIKVYSTVKILNLLICLIVSGSFNKIPLTFFIEEGKEMFHCERLGFDSIPIYQMWSRGGVMSELRYNYSTGEWVVIAIERAKRPSDFNIAKADVRGLPEYKDNCPFCVGNEGDLSDETFRIKDGKSWRVRSILNKFPAFSTKTAQSSSREGLFRSMGGFGIAEVVVEHKRHNSFIAFLEDKEVEDIIRVYKQRYLDISRIEGIKSIMIFKNHGAMAGTSVEHPHSQIVATPVVPMQVRGRVQMADQYLEITGNCLFCQTLEDELRTGQRIVLETNKFVTIVPYAAYVPFAVWIIPKRHSSSFGDISEDEISDLAINLKTVLGKLYKGLGNPDFNYAIRSTAVCEEPDKGYHWHLNIVPRINQPAGFELGSGIFINTSLPEECALFLRGI